MRKNGREGGKKGEYRKLNCMKLREAIVVGREYRASLKEGGLKAAEGGLAQVEGCLSSIVTKGKSVQVKCRKTGEGQRVNTAEDAWGHVHLLSCQSQ